MSAFKQTWRRWLLMGVTAAMLSLMIGLLVDAVFSSIARNIPALIRQDTRLSLPLCDIFPNLNGCQPFVGRWTGLQIAEISAGIGQGAGMVSVLFLTAVLSSFVSLQVGRLAEHAGILTGITASLISLLLMWLIGVPQYPNAGLGIFSIAVLTLLPASGWLGARYGGRRLMRKLPGTGLYTPTGSNTMSISGIDETLTDRELEVLLLVAEGLKNREIALRLHVSTATVKTHVLHIYDKLGVRSRTAAVRQALAGGLIRYGEHQQLPDSSGDP